MTTENETPDTGAEEPETTEDEPTLLDAISDAVDEVTDPSVLESKDDNDDDETDAGETDSGGDAAGESGTEDEANAEESPEGKPKDKDAAADDAEAGTPESGDDPEKDPDKEGGDKAGSDDAQSEVDPINDPIPESTNDKTATRIKSLIDIAKENTTHANERDELLEAITNSGTDPAQYSNTLGFLRLYNSTDPADRKQALEAVRGIVKELSLELGEIPQDVLAGHDDLLAEVEADTLTEKRAMEIATAREKKTLDDSRQTAANNQQATDDATMRAVQTGKDQLTAAESTLTLDPDYARLRPTFIAMLKPTLRNVHTSEWGATATAIFKELKAANPAPAVADPKPAPQTPLRPNSGAGGSSSDQQEGEPTDALAAVNDALSSM